jgi:hypothetical protein
MEGKGRKEGEREGKRRGEREGKKKGRKEEKIERLEAAGVGIRERMDMEFQS